MALEAVYDLPITYEDPIYVHESELWEKRTPKGVGYVSFTYEAPPLGATEEVRKSLAASALTDLLRNYNALRGMEMFDMTEDDSGFHVVPMRYVNKSGQIETLLALLDTPVSFATEERTGPEILEELVRAVSATAGQEIIIDRAHTGFQSDKRTSISASNESARSVLERLLKILPVVGSIKKPCISRGEGGIDPTVCYWDVPANLSWQLWCDVGQCLLHLHLITPPGARGGANVRLPEAPEIIKKQ